jgi:preprotein translocase subunit YajC
MDFDNLTVVLADAAAAPQPAPGWTMLVPFGLMFIMLYFAVIRPQSKKAKEHALLVQSLKPGDKVVTGSGIVATVVTVKERTATIRSADTKLEILKSAITDITGPADGGTGEN